MRNDIDILKEVISMQSKELLKLKQQLTIAKEALLFYSLDKHWDYQEQDKHKSSSKYEQYYFIKVSDDCYVAIEEGDTAEKALNKIGDIENDFKVL